MLLNVQIEILIFGKAINLTLLSLITKIKIFKFDKNNEG